MEIELKNGAVECPVEVHAQQDGCYTCSFTPQVPGFFRLHVTSGGKPLGGSPFSVKVSNVDQTTQYKVDTALSIFGCVACSARSLGLSVLSIGLQWADMSRLQVLEGFGQ